MENVTLLQISLDDYLSRVENPRIKVVADYCNHVRSLVDVYNKESSTIRISHKIIDLPDHLKSVVDSTVLCRLPDKYKSQIIADLVRYDYIYRNGGIYIDTDLELFNAYGLEVLLGYYLDSEYRGIGYTAGEFNKGRIFACNWIIIDQKGSRMAKYLYDNLVKWATDHKDDVIDENFDHWQVWGYALYRDMPQVYYDIIDPRLFQGYTWNQPWTNPDLDCRYLVGAHHFGLECENRPQLGEFKKRFVRSDDEDGE